jgi:16S rRNA (cytosine1402-N4)-methyltransferase
MDDQLTVTALDLLKALEVQELTKLFKVYGEERYAKPIAQAIKENISEIESVGDLTSIIYKVVPVASNNKNPSRRVFQALRIAVNDEINNLKEGLDKAFEILSPNGRLLVISFHSLEDRVVKNFFNKKDEEKKAKNLTKKPIRPSQEEIKNNPKSSSAKLRILRKI